MTHKKKERVEILKKRIEARLEKLTRWESERVVRQDIKNKAKKRLSDKIKEARRSRPSRVSRMNQVIDQPIQVLPQTITPQSVILQIPNLNHQIPTLNNHHPRFAPYRSHSSSSSSNLDLISQMRFQVKKEEKKDG